MGNNDAVQAETSSQAWAAHQPGLERRVDSLEEWQRVISDAMLPLQMVPARHGQQFRGKFRSREFAGIGLMLIEATPHSLARIEQEEVRGEHYFNVNIQLYGQTSIEQNGRRAELAPGDMVIFESSANYRRDFRTDYGSFVLMLPQSRLGLPVEAIAQITATGINGSEGFGSVLSTFLRGIADNFESFDERVGSRISQALVDLVTATLLHLLKVELSPRDVRLAQMRFSIRSYIDLHYADPSCTPQSIAEAYFISLRHLHTVFREERTTVAELLRQRRMEAARRTLEDPIRDWMAIANVATEVGFENPGSFARAFRIEFGMSPREYRRMR